MQGMLWSEIAEQLAAEGKINAATGRAYTMYAVRKWTLDIELSEQQRNWLAQIGVLARDKDFRLC